MDNGRAWSADGCVAGSVLLPVGMKVRGTVTGSGTGAGEYSMSDGGAGNGSVP